LVDLVWTAGIAGDFGRRFAVEASTLAFFPIDSGRRVLVEHTYAHTNGVCDARRICFEKYALKRMRIPMRSE
jgi:hypothetical protein